MRFTVTLPNCMHAAALTQPWEHHLSGRGIAAVAKRAEELGYSMVFCPSVRGTSSSMTPTRNMGKVAAADQPCNMLAERGVTDTW